MIQSCEQLRRPDTLIFFRVPHKQERHPVDLNEYYEWKKNEPYQWAASWARFERVMQSQLAEMKLQLYYEFAGITPDWGDTPSKAETEASKMREY